MAAQFGKTFMRITMEDSDGRERSVDFEITGNGLTADPGYLTAADNLAAVMDGTSASEMFAGRYERIELITTIEDPTFLTGTPTNGDVGNGWRLSFPDGSRRTMAARNTNGALTTLESKGTLADKTLQSVQDFYAALTNPYNNAPAPGFGVVDSSGATPSLPNLGIRASISSRQAPRV